MILLSLSIKIFTIVAILSTITLFYVVFIIILEHVSLRKIDKENVGRGLTEGDIKLLKNAKINRTNRLLLGLSKNEAILVTVNIILAFSAIASFLYGIQESKILNRPYYFIEKAEIQSTESEGFVYKVILDFENTGRTPAFLDNLRWGFTYKEQTLRNLEYAYIVNPNSKKKAWIFLSEEEFKSIIKPADNRLIFKLIYSDFFGVQYCTESEYSIVSPEGNYLLASESVRECKADSDSTASNQDEEITQNTP